MITALCAPWNTVADPAWNELAAKASLNGWILPVTDLSQAESFQAQSAASVLPVLGVSGLLDDHSSLGWLSGGDTLHQAVGVAKETIKQCGKCGAKWITLGSSSARKLAGIRVADAKALLCQMIEEIVPVLESRQVTLAIDPASDPDGYYPARFSDIMDLVTTLKHPLVRLSLNMACFGTGDEVETLVATSIPYTVSVRVYALGVLRQPLSHHKLASLLKSGGYSGTVVLHLTEPLSRERSLKEIRALHSSYC